MAKMTLLHDEIAKIPLSPLHARELAKKKASVPRSHVTAKGLPRPGRVVVHVAASRLAVVGVPCPHYLDPLCHAPTVQQMACHMPTKRQVAWAARLLKSQL